jgi:hypothetical protein
MYNPASQTAGKETPPPRGPASRECRLALLARLLTEAASSHSPMAPKLIPPLPGGLPEGLGPGGMRFGIRLACLNGLARADLLLLLPTDPSSEACSKLPSCLRCPPWLLSDREWSARGPPSSEPSGAMDRRSPGKDAALAPNGRAQAAQAPCCAASPRAPSRVSAGKMRANLERLS